MKSPHLSIKQLLSQLSNYFWSLVKKHFKKGSTYYGTVILKPPVYLDVNTLKLKLRN